MRVFVDMSNPLLLSVMPHAAHTAVVDGREGVVVERRVMDALPESDTFSYGPPMNIRSSAGAVEAVCFRGSVRGATEPPPVVAEPEDSPVIESPPSIGRAGADSSTGILGTADPGALHAAVERGLREAAARIDARAVLPTALTEADKEEQRMEDESDRPGVVFVGDSEQRYVHVYGSGVSVSGIGMRKLLEGLSQWSDKSVYIRSPRDIANLGRMFKSRMYLATGSWMSPFFSYSAPNVYRDHAGLLRFMQPYGVLADADERTEKPLAGRFVLDDRGTRTGWASEGLEYVYFLTEGMPPFPVLVDLCKDLVRTFEDVAGDSRTKNMLALLDELGKADRERREKERAEALQRFINAQRTAVDAQMQMAISEFRTEEQNYRKAVLATRQAERDLDEFNSRDHEEIMRTMLASASKDKRIVSASLCADFSIAVHTTALTVEHDGRKYALGSFVVQIPLSCEGHIHAFRQEGPIGGYHHPHITRDGSMCLGNMYELMRPARKQGQLDVVVSAVLEFLGHVNPGGWYTSVSHWPMAS